MMFRKLIVSSLLLCLFSLGAYTQDDSTQLKISDSLHTINLPLRQKGLIKLGVGMTGNYYVGDLSTSKFAYNRIYPGAYFSLSTDNPRRIKWVLNAGYANITEQDDNPRYAQTFSKDIHPNTYVSTDFGYGDVGIQIRAFKRHRFQPYLSAGLGFLFFSPKDKKNTGLLDQDFSRLEDETYSLVAFQAPFGFGFEYKILPSIGINLSYQYRLLSSDYIDNIGKLGVRPGNDLIQSLQFGLTFAPVPAPEYKQLFIPKRRPISDTAHIDSVVVKEEITPPSEQEFEDMLNSGKNLLFEVGKSMLEEENPDLQTPKVNPNNPPQGASFPQNTKDDTWDDADYDELAWLWKYVTEKAIKDNQYIDYQCNPGETYSSLYARFRVGAKTIRTINNITSGVIPPSNRKIKIPDTQKWMDMFPDIERIIKESGATPP